MSNPLVIGIDPSLTCTGMVSSDGGIHRVTSRPRGADITERHARLCGVVEETMKALWSAGVPDLVVIEGPGLDRISHGGPDLIGAWWLLVDTLLSASLPLAVAPPKCRAKYAAGNGNSGKDSCMAAVIRRYPAFEVTDNDTADALTLCAMGRDHLGRPLVAVPQVNRLGLAGVAWPQSSEGN